jgi:hypothetical protein
MAPSTRNSRTAGETATADAAGTTENPPTEPTVDENVTVVEKSEPTQESGEATTVTKTVAQFVGHVGTRRIITKEDQDAIIGVKGVATEDLVWEPGNTKIDVSNVDEEVLAYLKGDENFKLRTVQAAAGETA